MARYNITLPDDVVSVADKKAKEMGISRSAFIASAIQFKAQYDVLVSQLPSMMELIRDLRAGGVPLDPDNRVVQTGVPAGTDDGGRA